MEAPFAITRIVFGDEGFVEISNLGSEPADPAGFRGCQFPNYLPVPAGELQPGEAVRIEASLFGGLDSADGEVALYSEPEWEDPNAMVGYVQWGGGEHKRSPVAAAAGIWGSGAAVNAAGASELRTAAASQSPDGWDVVR